jgi:hypothetical protein
MSSIMLVSLSLTVVRVVYDGGVICSRNSVMTPYTPKPPTMPRNSGSAGLDTCTWPFPSTHVISSRESHIALVVMSPLPWDVVASTPARVKPA